MHYATLCAIAKDEDHSLLEWTRFHLHIGFEHIFIYDNGSREPIRRLLQDFVERGLVTVVDFPLKDRPQLSAYASALAEFGKDSVWMGFIDLDEFVVPKACADIRELLDGCAEHAGLAAHWKIFGSNGHETRPVAGVIKSYTGVVNRNNHIKTIVRPARVAGVATPHHFRYSVGHCCVNEDGVPVLGPQSYHASRRIQINHYYYK
ncbi:MAG: glycosyltransferase family 92 protein, partial [Deltaproteobacteria bacterium]|nr:glycosyltransferase family 92 protein [Deltaproteobacteria bacterium]